MSLPAEEIPADPLSPLHRWFAQQGWTPFDFQERTWAAYRAGRSGLVHAPTGVGKTLAAWLGPLSEGVEEALSIKAAQPAASGAAKRRSVSRRRSACEPIRVLWLTPLRALSADTAAALQEPVVHFDLPWTVECRTGDTSAALRARQREQLPTALVTTPESLTIQLSYPEARSRFSTVRCVVVDEWHELMGTKRGVLLELALARLRTWLTGLRTWGLSATLGNLEQARDVLLGDQAAEGMLIESDLTKDFQIDTIIPPDIERFPWSGHLGNKLVAEVASAIERSNSTLLFTNTRSQAEIWFRSLIRHRPDWIGRVALHHGSLDHKLRSRVEQMLKSGRALAVVCTSSLDLGVDFSPVDQVIQLGSPKGIARLLQRAGRAGHQPGAISRVLCVPTHAFELAEFAATREALAQRRVEARPPLELALDVLAQHVVTVAAGGGFRASELYAEVCRAHAYRNLSPVHWNWVLDFAARGGPSLTAYPQYSRIRQEDGQFVISSPQMARVHRMNVGVITGEAGVQVRVLNGRNLGIIEESFIDRLDIGDTFVFAGRLLELVLVRDREAIVRAARRGSGIVPRWNGGRFPLSTQLGDAVRRILNDPASQDAPEMQAVGPLLELQARWSRVPGPADLLVERITTRYGHHTCVFPFEGRLVHEGLSALVAYRLTRSAPRTIHLTATDYGFELLSEAPLELDAAAWRQLLGEDDLVVDLLACVNLGRMARRQFRDIARVAGLLQAGYPGAARTRRQLQASSELFFDVFEQFDPENLLLEQARREVLDQQLEIARLRRALQRIAQRDVLIVQPPRLTPLAFPLNAERLRAQSVSSEKWSDRVRKMALQLERVADGASREPQSRVSPRQRVVRA